MAVTNYMTFGGMIVHENRGGVQRDCVPDTLGFTAALVDTTQTITDVGSTGLMAKSLSEQARGPLPSRLLEPLAISGTC